MKDALFVLESYVGKEWVPHSRATTSLLNLLKMTPQYKHWRITTGNGTQKKLVLNSMNASGEIINLTPKVPLE